MATGDRKYTVQESNNLSIGQTHSMWLDNTSSATPPSNTVFIAIQVINDIKFNTTGVVAEDPLTCINNGTGNVDNSFAGGTGDKINANTTIPAGTILYGRWTSIQLDTGCVCLYIGG